MGCLQRGKVQGSTASVQNPPHSANNSAFVESLESCQRKAGCPSSRRWDVPTALTVSPGSRQHLRAAFRPCRAPSRPGRGSDEAPRPSAPNRALGKPLCGAAAFRTRSGAEGGRSRRPRRVGGQRPQPRVPPPRARGAEAITGQALAHWDGRDYS